MKTAVDAVDPEQPPLDIAVGVLVDGAGRLLIAKRRDGTPGAGRWEFPGGKREAGEAMPVCLARELAEEIGVRDLRVEPLIRFSHDRGEQPVRLHVWRVDAWTGEPSGREGQRLEWIERGQLTDIDLLPATDAILQALFLPRRYAITPSLAAADAQAWWSALDATLAKGLELLRLRDKGLDDDGYGELAKDVIARAHVRGTRVLVDRDRAMCDAVGADGLHWPAARLIAQCARELPRDRLLAVSAHSSAELEAAARLGADFAVLSPVAATPSHPGVPGMGWDGWAAARADHALPVYALGGLGDADIVTARSHNAQGVAAIRGFWGTD